MGIRLERRDDYDGSAAGQDGKGGKNKILQYNMYVIPLWSAEKQENKYGISCC